MATGAQQREAVRIGVVGTGALGRHHVRLLREIEGAELVGVHDLRPEVAAAVAAEFGTAAFPALDELAARVEAMVVAVPTVAHASVGGGLLDRGIHCLVEKPIAASLAQADELVERAAARGRVLAVGHVEFFNPAVQRLLAYGERPRFVEIDRLSVFTPRSLDIDVVLDLMIHDLQILQALDQSAIVEVRAVGIDVLSPRIDIADARLELASGTVAHLKASRVSAERVRQLRAFFSSRYLSLDYQAQTLRGYELVADPGGATRRIVSAAVDVISGEPLRRELEAFVARCRGVLVPWVDGAGGRRALAAALAVAEAIANR